jgi:hypothetical protein
MVVLLCRGSTRAPNRTGGGGDGVAAAAAAEG